MISSLFHSIIFQPFYNGLIFLIDKLPFLDAGIVIVIFTILTKIILLPLSIKASKAQIEMKSIEKDLQDIKEKHKDNKEEQTAKTLALYKEKNVNPFAGIFVLIVQLPIIIGIYQVFLKSGLPVINTAWLYSFISVPQEVNMMFLSLTNIAQKSITLALIAGITTYLQISLANKAQGQTQSNGGGMGQDIAKAMAVQMKYVFPVIVVFISYSISGALALYWITSNAFAIGQEIYIRKKYHKVALVV